MKYLLSSKRTSCKLTSKFNITSHIEELLDSNNFYLGLVESNFFGTAYNLYDGDETKKERQILATICYENQITCKSEPRNIEVYIISPLYSYDKLEGVDGEKNLKELYEISSNAEQKRILKLINKKPKWN